MEMAQGLKPVTLAVMVAATCLLLGNIYYAQPVLYEIASQTGLTGDDCGLIVSFGQLGYIFGLIFLAPLGDVFENRYLCPIMTLGAALFALLASIAENTAIFLMSVFCMGAFATATQILVVFATIMAGPERSGRMLGIMASGLFLGIALSRPVSSYITVNSGWRSVYALSGVALLTVCLMLFLKLPEKKIARRPTCYLRVIGEMFSIGFSTPGFLNLTMLSFSVFMGFTMFWSTAPICLSGSSIYGKEVVSFFTLAGLITPPVMLLVGNLLDGGYAKKITSVSLLTILGGWLLTLWMPPNFWIFFIAALLIDPCSSASTVTVQKTLLASVCAEKRGRINSLNISCNFLGGAAGAALGPWMLGSFSWEYVAFAGLAIVFASIIFNISALGKR